jgi:hypothetical protein
MDAGVLSFQQTSHDESIAPVVSFSAEDRDRLAP